MADLRKFAKGRECAVRIPGVCNFNPETTVLAHLNMIGISGRGLKAPDQLGAWCCSACHDEIDGRTRKYFAWDSEHKQDTRNEINVMFYEGIFRTQHELIKKGLL